MEKLTREELNTALEDLANWSVVDGFISKSFQFKNFKEAFSFMTRVAFEAEALEHHPNWENVYNTVTINLNTHDANGITQKDISLAKRIDAIG